jgi:hypothetical protein
MNINVRASSAGAQNSKEGKRERAQQVFKGIDRMVDQGLKHFWAKRPRAARPKGGAV